MNNYFHECPPRMDDGTHFTDWVTNSIRNDIIKTSHNIVRDDHYRIFLQQNGEKIMDFLWDNDYQSLKCENKPCIHTYPTRVTYPMLDEEFKKYNNFTKKYNYNELNCTKYKDYRIGMDN